MAKICFDCRKDLKAVPQPEWMNEDQWDAIKSGDYFAKCDQSARSNGNCYFRDTAGLNTLKRVSNQQEGQDG